MIADHPYIDYYKGLVSNYINVRSELAAIPRTRLSSLGVSMNSYETQGSSVDPPSRSCVQISQLRGTRFRGLFCRIPLWFACLIGAVSFRDLIGSPTTGSRRMHVIGE